MAYGVTLKLREIDKYSTWYIIPSKYYMTYVYRPEYYINPKTNKRKKLPRHSSTYRGARRNTVRKTKRQQLAS